MTLQASYTDETDAAVQMIVVSDDCPDGLQVGSTITVLNHEPSSVQNIIDGELIDVSNTTNNIFYPPCGSGRITILKREPSTAEATGAVKMLSEGSEINCVEATFTIINEASSTSLAPLYTLLPISHLQQTSTNNTHILLGEEIPQMLTEPPARVYVYKSGAQYPEKLIKPREGSVLDVLLQNNPMIEILSVHKKGTDNYFTAACHSCQKEYKSCNATGLLNHTTSPIHKRRLSVSMHGFSDVDVKELSRRKLLISNKKFAPFLYLQDDQTLFCKWCNVQLPFKNDKITAHRYTVKHQAAADIHEANTFTEAEKLKHLHKVVNMYPDVLALVSEYDKKINDEYFEPYKTADQITLQVNDLYCKICRQKLNSSNPNHYIKSVRSHINSKRHLREVELHASIPPGDRRRSPKKITTFRHDEEDLKELARVFTETKLPISKCDVALRKVTQATIHRRVSTKSLKKVIESLDTSNFKNES